MRYEDAIGPLDTGCLWSTPELQKEAREMDDKRNADEVWLSLSVCHDTMDPDQISDIFELEPDDVKRVGDTIFRNEKYHIKSDRTMWHADTSEYLDCNSFEEHLRWLCEHLHGKTPDIHRLLEEGCEIEIVAHIDLMSYGTFPSLSVEAMRFLAQLRIPLRFIVRYLNAVEFQKEETTDDGESSSGRFF